MSPQQFLEKGLNMIPGLWLVATATGSFVVYWDPITQRWLLPTGGTRPPNRVKLAQIGTIHDCNGQFVTVIHPALTFCMEYKLPTGTL